MVIYSGHGRLCDFWDNREQQEGGRGAAEGRDGRRRGGVHHPQGPATAEGRRKIILHLNRWPEHMGGFLEQKFKGEKVLMNSCLLQKG